MDSDNYRILGAGILIGAFTVVVIWLLSGEASYNPERDFEQRGAPLIITQVPSAPSAAIELQPLPIPSNAPQPLTEQPEELVITELATTLPVVPEQSPPQAVPEAEAASASVAPPAAESAAVAPAATAELTPQQIVPSPINCASSCRASSGRRKFLIIEACASAPMITFIP